MNDTSTRVVPVPAGALLKSCEACRSSKSKCIASEDPHSTTCQRCAKLIKQCTFKSAQPRPKRGKQTKSAGRVAVVEKKVDDIHALLQSLQQSNTPSTATTQTRSPSSADDLSIYEAPSLLRARSDQLTSNALPACFETYHHPDVFDKGILTIEQGNELLEQYKQIDTHFPFIQLQRVSNVNELRQKSPFLLLAILITPTRELRGLHSVLDKELREQISKRVFVEGEKSIDLLQGLLVYLAWYHIHFHPQRQQMYQFSALAAAMTVDLGLHRSVQKAQDENNLDEGDPQGVGPLLRRAPLEERRTSVASYIVASSTAMCLRRPNVFRYNDYLEECCYKLSAANELSSDAHLIHKVRLHRISEEASEAFGYSTSPALPMGVETLQHTVKGFQQRLISLHRTFPPEAESMYSLMLYYHGACIYVHEISLHVDPAISRLPNTAPSTPDPTSIVSSLLLTTLDCTRKLLTYFLTIPPSTIAFLSITDLMRVTYAIIVLGKLTLNPTLIAALSAQNTDIQLPSYVSACITHINPLIRTEAGVEVRDCFWHFRRMLTSTRDWYEAKLAHPCSNGTCKVGKDRRDDPTDLDPMQVVGGWEVHQNCVTGEEKTGNACEAVAGKGEVGTGGAVGAVGVQAGMGMEYLAWSPDDGFWEEMLSSWPQGMEGVVSV